MRYKEAAAITRARRDDPARSSLRNPLVLVRMLLFLALAAIAGAGAAYLFKRDKRYLRFVWRVVQYTILLLLGILIFYAFERLIVVA